MGGEVRGPELHGPPARQRLALITAGEEGELARVLAPYLTKPAAGKRQRLVPGDFFELAGAALADAQ
jgi:hypothetical protein